MLSRICNKGTSSSARFLWQAKKMSLNSVMATSTYAKPFKPLPSHAHHWKTEKIYSLLTLPLAPAAYFIHGTSMDYVLTAVLAIHMHYGGMTIVTDYARPLVIGKNLTAIAVKSVYLCTALIFIGLLHFNYYDVGLTRAFEMVFSL